MYPTYTQDSRVLENGYQCYQWWWIFLKILKETFSWLLQFFLFLTETETETEYMWQKQELCDKTGILWKKQEFCDRNITFVTETHFLSQIASKYSRTLTESFCSSDEKKYFPQPCKSEGPPTLKEQKSKIKPVKVTLTRAQEEKAQGLAKPKIKKCQRYQKEMQERASKRHKSKNNHRLFASNDNSQSNTTQVTHCLKSTSITDYLLPAAIPQKPQQVCPDMSKRLRWGNTKPQYYALFPTNKISRSPGWA